MLKCDDCGKFMGKPGSWAEIYDFVGMQLDHTHFRCERCTEHLGPVETNAKPWNGDLSSYQGVN